MSQETPWYTGSVIKAVIKISWDLWTQELWCKNLRETGYLGDRADAMVVIRR